jgi:hypothetical protein
VDAGMYGYPLYIRQGINYVGRGREGEQVNTVKVTKEVILFVDEEIVKGVALAVFGTNDGVRFKFPRTCGVIQDAMEKVAEAQLANDKKQLYLWGIASCFEHSKGGGVLTKRECPECWKSLNSEEVKGDEEKSG